MTKINLIEIGAGYGGLALAISHFCKNFGINIESYDIIDLDVISQLQKMYLSNFDLNFPINVHDAALFGSDLNLDKYFLISNYCFSEIDKKLQEKYIEILFQKVNHGFFVWNAIPLYDIGKQIITESERPETGNNLFVKF